MDSYPCNCQMMRWVRKGEQCCEVDYFLVWFQFIWDRLCFEIFGELREKVSTVPQGTTKQCLALLFNHVIIIFLIDADHFVELQRWAEEYPTRCLGSTVDTSVRVSCTVQCYFTLRVMIHTFLGFLFVRVRSCMRACVRLVSVRGLVAVWAENMSEELWKVG